MTDDPRSHDDWPAFLLLYVSLLVVRAPLLVLLLFPKL
jgi:hypothetical protein